ncbi:unnamed protein product [Phaedon cochleariae]|uniref:TOG domain-containing protein n=1 Tax=Phaedon cochleariae TaxID=80249 RepID=A0A9N9X538_PHACE|nr:unnamed protein product [Phaedon cochleariae]
MPHSDQARRRKTLFSNSVYPKNHDEAGTFVCEKNKTMSTQTNFNSSTTVNLGKSPNKVQVYRETQTQTSKTVISLDCPKSSVGDFSPDSLSPRFDNYKEELSPRSKNDKFPFSLHSFRSPRYNFGKQRDDITPQQSKRNQECSTNPEDSADRPLQLGSNQGFTVKEKMTKGQNASSSRLASSSKKLLTPRALDPSPVYLESNLDKECETEKATKCCGDVLDPQPTGSKLSTVPSHKRKQAINYLDQCEGCHQCEMCEKRQKELMSGNVLTKTFLEKNRSKIRGYSYSDRTNYGSSKLKSQSYVESLQLSMESPRMRGKTRIPVARTAMKNADEKYTECTRPLHNLCHPSLASNLDEISQMEMKAKSYSFMSPTISSERKDKSIEIKCLGKLISPTRRGRSTSPEHDFKAGDAGKVPYIDKSDITFDKTRKESKLSVKSSCNETASNTSTGSTENALFQAIGKLRDENWNTALRGLAEVVEICRLVDSELVFPHMTIINQRLVELIKSPRSHVCRTSCQAVGHLFEFIKDTRRPEFDELVDTLLCKCADSNKFIRHDANLALDCMVTHMPTFHSVRAVTSKAPDHKNPLVRTAAARLLVCALVLHGPPNVLHPQSNEYTRRRVVHNMVKFMEDRYGDVRKYGERIYKMLNKDRTFELYLNRYLERDVVNKLRHTFRT